MGCQWRLRRLPLVAPAGTAHAREPGSPLLASPRGTNHVRKRCSPGGDRQLRISRALGCAGLRLTGAQLAGLILPPPQPCPAGSADRGPLVVLRPGSQEEHLFGALWEAGKMAHTCAGQPASKSGPNTPGRTSSLLLELLSSRSVSELAQQMQMLCAQPLCLGERAKGQSHPQAHPSAALGPVPN